MYDTEGNEADEQRNGEHGAQSDFCGGEHPACSVLSGLRYRLAWYQDAQLCKQVDNRDFVYDLPLLKRMYHYLDTHGELFYIEYRGVLCGDVSLRTTGELAIVICKEYQNKHIGRKVIEKMLELARERGLAECFAHIYSFNTQSQKMFESIGFVPQDEERYIYKIDKRRTDHEQN